MYIHIIPCLFYVFTVVEFGERFAYYGISGNLINYLVKVLKEPVATAAQNVNVWHGVSAIFPLVGGFLADSYFGRFNMIIFASITYLLVRSYSDTVSFFNFYILSYVSLNMPNLILASCLLKKLLNFLLHTLYRK